MPRKAKLLHPDIVAKIIQLKKNRVDNATIMKDFGLSSYYLKSLTQREIEKGQYSKWSNRKVAATKPDATPKTKLDPDLIYKVVELKKAKFKEFEIAIELGINRGQVNNLVVKAGKLGLYTVRKKKAKTKPETKTEEAQPKLQTRLEIQQELDEARRIRPDTVKVREYQGFVFRTTPGNWLFPETV